MLTCLFALLAVLATAAPAEDGSHTRPGGARAPYGAFPDAPAGAVSGAPAGFGAAGTGGFARRAPSTPGATPEGPSLVETFYLFQELVEQPFSAARGSAIGRDSQGRMIRIGDATVKYDRSGRPVGVAGYDVAYDSHGRVVRFGGEPVRRDMSGRPVAIGSERIAYDSRGKVIYLGSARVDRDLSGRISRVGDKAVAYDSSGRWTQYGDMRLYYQH